MQKDTISLFDESSEKELSQMIRKSVVQSRNGKRFGEVIHINLLRHADTGKSRGFCFLCYQDQRSTILAVDNFNGITLLKRMIRVDHVEQYKVPKYKENADEETKRLWEEGCAPKPIQLTEADMKQSDEEEEEAVKTKILSLKDDELYGQNSHFNFGKKTEAAEEPTHNPRPDFEKADWRDIEIWKEIREREKAEQAPKKVDWKPEEHYVSSRYR
ncbi:hypothetical protein TELCIR_14287 [Teladorsagia circumcincta]|uniref:RRM domain-containing protein n=1 Tax=Teladorsagia circumcincta TaxID=45464 RepID=A0A2G9U1N7_TELCI|nr:hypothetical protein TELCIR_14287 [Teladorsagia circumcincta]